ncbi:hypothetical protein LWH94_17705 [Marinobacter sp. G11]|uniref:hypothetical protein n=1 Tax=Marinobacter sp. G11 TaxID=2903522 RepID=UPI001E2C3629|nr:hypothetical protein [Marinobacter sp. G11]MCE0761017.1 hypothetical protein [Marinobacter sp. G11]
MKVETVVRLPMADSGLQNSIVRLNNRNMDSTRKDRARFFRREPLVIVNNVDGSKILRYAMGSSGLGICKNAVGLDYDGVDALNIRFKEPVDLEIRRAKRWEVWQWFWQHPDQSVQLSIRLGIAGALLGILGFLTGVTPLILN